MPRKMFALLDNQGSAMALSALCEKCVANMHFKAVAEAAVANDPTQDSDGDFVDCTGNDELSCMSCGYQTQFAHLRNDEGEVVVQLASGWTLRSGCSDDEGFVSGEYVRLCTPDGEEHLYWDNAEWHDEPVLVMGAIINSAAGVVLERVPSPAGDERGYETHDGWVT